MAARRLTVDLERRHRDGPTVRAAFEVDLAAGEVLALFGPSGSGKTTVLRCLAGLERPHMGRISANGAVWFDAANGTNMPPQLRSVGYVPQGYALFPHLSVQANIGYGVSRVPAAARGRRVAELVSALGLAGLEQRRPGQLSGGQRQRVALGRALATEPLLLLLDEPLAALDEATRAEVRTALGESIRASGTAALLVSHDPTDVLALADRVAVLVEGVIHQVGAAEDVFLRPQDEVVARLVGADVLGFGVVAGSTDGLVEVDLHGQRLVAIGELAAGSRVLVSVRPEEVTLMDALPSGSGLSTRNLISGVVAALEAQGTLILVTLEAHIALRALVTRQAVAELGLARGARAVAAVKAPSIHLVPAPH